MTFLAINDLFILKRNDLFVYKFVGTLRNPTQEQQDGQQGSAQGSPAERYQ